MTMRIGLCTVDVYISGITSLKGKRSVVKSLKERLKNRFNVSVAEIDSHDLLQRASLGIAIAGNDAKKLNSEMDKILGFIEKTQVVDLINHQIEII
jgi:uncharacterized protein YlxP (DUF503 family)